MKKNIKNLLWTILGGLILTAILYIISENKASAVGKERFNNNIEQLKDKDLQQDIIISEKNSNTNKRIDDNYNLNRQDHIEFNAKLDKENDKLTEVLQALSEIKGMLKNRRIVIANDTINEYNLVNVN